MAVWSRLSDAASNEPASIRVSFNWVRMCSAASPAPPRERCAQREKRRFQQRNRQWNRFARKGWNPALQLGGDIPGGQRQPRQPAALNDFDQIGHYTEQLVLQRYGGLEFGPKTQEGR